MVRLISCGYLSEKMSVRPYEILPPRTGLVKEFILKKMKLGPKESENLSLVVDGLILVEKPSINSIASNSDRKIDQSTLSRSIGFRDTELIVFDEELLRSMAYDRRTGLKEDGIWIIDDTVCEKTGKHMPGASKHRGGGGFAYGYDIVLLMYADSEKHYPIAIGIYLRKKDFEEGLVNEEFVFRTRNDIAQRMLERIPDEFVVGKTLVCDAWYCNKQIVDAARSKQMKFISRLKKNRVATSEYGKMAVSQLHEHLNGADWNDHPDKKLSTTQKILGLDVTLTGIGQCRAVIIKNVDDPPVNCYLVSSEMLSAEEIVSIYKRRWNVETWFRDVKQRLGLDKFMVRDLYKVMGWIRAVMVAYMVLLWIGRLGIFARLLGVSEKGLTAMRQQYAYLAERARTIKALELQKSGLSRGHIMAEVFNNPFFIEQEKRQKRKKRRRR